jgi:hypothetical protein
VRRHLNLPKDNIGYHQGASTDARTRAHPSEVVPADRARRGHPRPRWSRGRHDEEIFARTTKIVEVAEARNRKRETDVAQRGARDTCLQSKDEG